MSDRRQIQLPMRQTLQNVFSVIENRTDPWSRRRRRRSWLQFDWEPVRRIFFKNPIQIRQQVQALVSGGLVLSSNFLAKSTQKKIFGVVVESICLNVCGFFAKNETKRQRKKNSPHFNERKRKKNEKHLSTLMPRFTGPVGPIGPIGSIWGRGGRKI